MNKITLYNKSMLYKLEIDSGDRQQSSTYAHPFYTNVNLPNLNNLQDYDFVKVRVAEAIVNADITSGDRSRVEIELLNKSALNGVRAANGTIKTTHLCHVPFFVKESGHANMYCFRNTHPDDYLLFPISAFQDNNMEFHLTNGDHADIAAPSSADFEGYVFTLLIEPVRADQL